MEQKTISVIIPVYNVEKYIEKCARSLLEQTYKNLELIFINDSSTDCSWENLNRVLGEYPNRNIKLVQHKVNKGSSSTRNDGLLLATGDYISFVDADDWIELDMYQQLYDAMQDTNADTVVCDFYREYNDNTEIVHTVSLGDNKAELITRYLMSPLTPVWNMLIKVDILQKFKIKFLDGFDWCEDLNFSLKIFYLSRNVHFLRQPLYHYRDNIYGYCHTTSKKKYISRLENVIDLYSFFAEKEVFDKVKQFFFYRVLLSKQFYLYENKDITAYMTLCPESNNYILSNPLYGKKAKFVEWLSVILYSCILKLLNIKI